MNILDQYIEQLNNINSEYLRICELLTYEEVVLDKKLFLKLEKQKQIIAPLAIKFQEYLELSNSLTEFTELLGVSSQNERMVIQEEIKTINENLKIITDDLIVLLNSFKAVNQEIVIELVCPDSQNQLKSDITNGYISFCENKGLIYKKSNNKATTLLEVCGLNSKEYFKNEVGIHVSNLSTNNVQVYVYDKFHGEECTFNDSDILIETCHASGAGGQHINTTDSAIKITHLKTGITATCQNERSQLQNKIQALENLKNKVYKYFSDLEIAYVKDRKKEQIKLIKNHYITKSYDYSANKIIKNNKQEISFKDFLLGKII